MFQIKQLAEWVSYFWLISSQLAYKAGTEQIIHKYTASKDEPLYRQAKANAELLSDVCVHSQICHYEITCK